MNQTTHRVLIIEDEFISREVLKTMVHQFSLPTEVAETSAQAIELAITLRPSLILLDQELPDGSGLATYQAIRAELQEDTPPAAMISGHQTPKFIAQCLAAGIEHCWSKPVTPRQLAELFRITGHIE